MKDRYFVSRSVRAPHLRALAAVIVLSVVALAGAGCYGTYADGYGSAGVTVVPSYTYGTYYGSYYRGYPPQRGYYRSQPFHGGYYRGHPHGGYSRGYRSYAYRGYRY